MSTLAAALNIVALGLPIFPCGPEKRPLVPGGFKVATCDAKQIKDWWTRWPDAMIGMPSGLASGIDVLDIDNKNGNNGFDALPDWEQRSNIIVRTPTGGVHLYFCSDGTVRNSASQLAPGLDVRGEGGYVIIPPSCGALGSYKFERGGLDDLGSLPSWPDDLSQTQPRARAARQERKELSKQFRSGIVGPSRAAAAELEDACEEIASSQKGTRNDTLNRVAFMMGQLVGAYRLDEALAVERLTFAAEKSGLELSEIDRTLSGGITAGKKSPRFPTIKMVKGQIARNVDFAEAELIAAGVPVFERAGVLVHPIKSELLAADGNATEGVLLRALRTENIGYLLNSEAAVFKRYDERKRAWVEMNPPHEVSAHLMHKGQWIFAKVAGVITTPTMRPDGTILDSPGYDCATQLWYSPDRYLKLKEIPREPTRGDAEAALALLKGLLIEFPFETEVDRSVALAALSSQVLRGAFDVAPMFLFLAHVAGSGKSYLVNLAASIATGRPCPVITDVASRDEMEKRLGALVLEGASVISLDNLSHDLGGDLLCQITEQRLLKPRILGKSEMPECEWRGTLYATGNNVRLLGDMTRRGLVCNLDAKLERPELRDFSFDPIALVRKDRGAYVNALLTIARAYRVAKHQGSIPPIGSYGMWSAAVRAPLMWLGEPDPILSMDAAREADPVSDAARTLVALWRDHLTLGVPYSAAELVKAATEAVPSAEMGVSIPSYEFVRPELRDLLMAQAGSPRGQIETKRLGHWLMAVRGQIHDGHRIDLVKESSRHGNRYALTAA